MESRVTFSQKLAGAFALLVLIALVTSAVAVYALRDVVARKDHVIDVAAQRLVDAERLHAMSFWKAADSRAYLMTGDVSSLQNAREAHARFQATIETLKRTVETDAGRELLEEADRAEEEHDRVLQAVLAARAPGVSLEALGARLEREVLPLRKRLNAAVDQFIAREERLLREQRRESTEAAQRASQLVQGLALLGVIAGVALAFLLARALSRQISNAVRHVQSSSAELQAAAGQQATGAKQQATAMAEITTTISELLATSRQIAESAQRVAAIAAETAGAAGAGDQTVQRSQ